MRTLCIILALLAASAPQLLSSAEKNYPKCWAFIPKIAAEIDGRKIPREELLDKILSKIPEKSSIPEDDLKPIALRALDELAFEHFYTKTLKENGIQPSPAIVKEDFKKNFEALSKEEKEKFEEYLQKNKKTMEQYLDGIASNKAAQFHASVAKYILSKIDIPEAKVEQYYRENQEKFLIPAMVRASHILSAPSGGVDLSEKIKTGKNGKGGAHAAKNGKNDDIPENAKLKPKTSREKAEDEYDKTADITPDMEKLFAEAKRKIDTCRAKIIQGEDFAKVAKASSDCKLTREKGGDLGEVPEGYGWMSIPQLAAAVRKLKPGEVSEPVRTEFGYHLVKVVQKKKSSFVPYEQVKQGLREFMTRQESQKMTAGLFEKEKDKLGIKPLF